MSSQVFISNTKIEFISSGMEFKPTENLQISQHVTKSSMVNIIDSFYPVTTTNDRLDWNQILGETASFQTEINLFITELSKSIKKAKLHKEYLSFLKKAEKTYSLYSSEMEKTKKNKFKDPSLESLYQLVRFMPEYPRKDLLHIYLDEMTGAFGLVIKSQSVGKPILNLLMKDNKEIVFSFIKKNTEIIKISGRAYFNNSLNDSHEIKKILRMISYE